MNFVVIDVETANFDMSSICQIGVACYNSGKIVKTFKTYIDPEDFFDEINICIHGIDEDTIFDAPTIPEVSEQLYKLLDNQIVVCHTHFDRVAIKQVCNKYQIRLPVCTWLDSARVARRTWSDIAWKGYGLQNICKFLKYDFKHHDALEDAKAAGYILLAASQKCNFNLEDWLKRVTQPIDLTKAKLKALPITREGNPEGDLFGEVVVFTGALKMPRREAADMAANIGCYVGQGVTKKTTMLIVGDQDIRKLAGHKKSNKHRKVVRMIKDGALIRILRETDFKELVNLG